MTATATATTRTRQAPPHEPIWELAQATFASRSLHVVAALDVADQVGDGPVPAEDLAAACCPALEPVLRLLAAHGIVEVAASGYRHTTSSLAPAQRPPDVDAGVRPTLPSTIENCVAVAMSPPATHGRCTR